MTGQLRSWVPICPISAIQDGKATDLNINGQRLVIARSGETISVLQGFCSHMLFPLSGSEVKDCVLTCSLHRSTFNIQNGSVKDWSTFPPLVGKALAMISTSKALRTFESRIENDMLYVAWAISDPSSARVKVG